MSAQKRDTPLHVPSQSKKTEHVAPIFATGKGKMSQLKATPASTSHQAATPMQSSAHKRRADESAPLYHAVPMKRSKATSGSHKIPDNAPLAERLRPQSLDEFVGQSHLTGPDSLLMGLLGNGSTGSMIFWGPPGYPVFPTSHAIEPHAFNCSCGKTTLARLLAKQTNAVFKELSATDSGISDVRAVAEEAKNVLALTKR